MAVHDLKPIRQNLHGHFSRDLPPILTLQSGDTVLYHNIPDAAWNTQPAGNPNEQSVKFEPRDPELDSGHCLLGPVAIQDAEPGDTLEVQIINVIPSDRGWTRSGGWPHEVHKRLGTDTPGESALFWQLEDGFGKNQYGHRVILQPFLGVMGMPQDTPGIQPTPPPRRTGGNLDCKELVAGVSLYLPVEVAGGLFSTGDGHAAQGDGEVCVTAIECPIHKAELRFILHKDLKIGTPRARNSHEWITLGVHEDLNEAVFQALEEMTDLMSAQFEVDRKTALALASVVVDLRVTQIVNGVKGVHAILEDGVLQKN